MSNAGNVGRISETAFKATSLTLLGISILATAARTIIRLKTRRRLYTDDGFLFFGIACLCMATGLLQPTFHINYLQRASVFYPNEYKRPLGDLPKFLKTLKLNAAFIVLTWTTIYSVKLSLLIFFLQLVERLPRLTLYVKSVMVITVLAWAYLVVQPFIACPYFDVKGVFGAFSITSTVTEQLADKISKPTAVLPTYGLLRHSGFLSPSSTS
ncbi:MAG: hypothetical protein Q9172_004995 [Xanthocarpia lactea]